MLWLVTRWDLYVTTGTKTRSRFFILTPSLPKHVQFPGWKNVRANLQTVYFQCYALWWKFFHMPVQQRRHKGWRVSNLALFYWSFSSSVMAVKGLSERLTNSDLYPMSKERRGRTEGRPKCHNSAGTPPSLRLSTPLIQQGCSVSWHNWIYPPVYLRSKRRPSFLVDSERALSAITLVYKVTGWKIPFAFKSLWPTKWRNDRIERAGKTISVSCRKRV